jgi:hypothetical protein
LTRPGKAPGSIRYRREMPHTDWKALAQARGPEIAEAELDRIAGPLISLEKKFRPLAQAVASDLQPATVFRADVERGE